MGVFREKENCGPCWGKSGVFVASLTLCYSGGTVLINYTRLYGVIYLNSVIFIVTLTSILE
jgi:hypothetical protein